MALVQSPALGEDEALSLADLARYRTALIDRETRSPALPVTFRELWDHPDRYQGRRVQVEGRVVRRFRQGPLGTFPPLVEAWAVTPKGDPFCWVFPEGDGKLPPPNATARFVGTYLRRIRYEGADVPRLAPLIVGPRPPLASPASPARARPAWPGSRAEWVVGMLAALVVAAVLATQHLRRPARRSQALEPGPAPEFVADQSGSHEDAERLRDMT